MMKRPQFVIINLLVLAASLIIFIHYFPEINPKYGMRLPIPGSDVEKYAYQLADELALDIHGYIARAKVQRNIPLIRQLQTEKGIAESNQLLREGVPGFFWRIHWLKTDQTLVPQNTPPGARDESGPPPPKPNEWLLNSNGKLLLFKWVISDSVELPRLTAHKAREVAIKFIAAYSPFNNLSVQQTTLLQDSLLSLTESSAADSAAQGNTSFLYTPGEGWVYRDGKSTIQSHRVDYEFIWKTYDPVTTDSVEIKSNVTGNQVTSLDVKYIIPKVYQIQGRSQFRQVFASLMYVIIGIITIVIAFQRWRSYELSFSFASTLGALISVLFAIYFYQILWDQNMGWVILIPVVVGAVLNGAIFVSVWAVGESLGREVWPEKFISLDLIRNRYWMHSKIGKGIFRGIVIGIAASAVSIVLLYWANRYSPLVIIYEDQQAVEFINALSTLSHFISLHGFASIFYIATFVLLLLSLIRRHTAAITLLVPLPALILVLLYQNHYDPAWLGVIIQTLASALSVWAFYRYDILTSVWAMFTSMTFGSLVALFTTGNNDALTSGYLSAAFFAAAIIYGLSTMVSRDRISDYKRLVPSFAKQITERQRLQRELEIAHEVQMSFLPARNPEFMNLDIAAQCKPALEVGGDYYDFVELDNKRLGVVIGDVSGKGTQAAFYMTLTKGFWRALANPSNSPAKVLTKLNKLFYDNVKRGVFISMIYGIFDMENGILSLARAGHNPVVMHRSGEKNMQTINPRGLALGMEKGIRFGKMIQEVKIPIKAGDLFVFYTDGFTEAMDKNRMEYGETRFEQTIEKHAASSADAVMKSVFKDVKQFSGRATQHDDMTIVVVKITENGRNIKMLYSQ